MFGAQVSYFSMMRKESHTSGSLFTLVFALVLAVSVVAPQERKGSWFRFLSPRQVIRSIKSGDNRLFETLFRPLEFKDPVITMPVEGRYGIGYYGGKGFNPVAFDSRLITYEAGTEDIIEDVGLSSRMGSIIEIDAVQTNLSYLLFNKSYLDILTGVGFRYSSIYGLPTIELTDELVIAGPPEVPSSWGVEKKFSPQVLEGNVVTSFIMQWSPKWLLHLKYSYGLNRTRFYRDDGMDDVPFGTGTSSTVSVGLKYVLESETAARYAWGFELRRIYHKVGTIRDPDDVTPVSGFRLPTVGLFFSFGTFYGGHPTVGNEGKKLFLKGDYVSARRKLVQFVNENPNHARIERARRLLRLSEERIPLQLYTEGIQLVQGGKMDEALERFVGARLTADEELEKEIRTEIEKIVDYFLAIGDTLLKTGQYDSASRMGRKAGAVSERGWQLQKILEGRIYLSQGKDLALRGFFSLALGKFSDALEVSPSLKEDVRKSELEVAVKMLEDVNKASDVASLRLALKSLYQVEAILGKSDPSMSRVIGRLEGQLSYLDNVRLRRAMEERMNDAREEIARRHAPRVERGMLVSEVQAILGDPHEVVEKVDDKKRNHQMWIYYLPNKKKKYFYFDDYVLYDMEEK